MSADGGGNSQAGETFCKLCRWQWSTQVNQNEFHQSDKNDSMSQHAVNYLVLVQGIRDLVETHLPNRMLLQWTFKKNRIFLEDEEVKNSFQLKVFLKQWYIIIQVKEQYKNSGTSKQGETLINMRVISSQQPLLLVYRWETCWDHKHNLFFQQLPHHTQTHTSRSPETGESNNWTPSCTRSKSRRRYCVSNLIKCVHNCSFLFERLASRAGGPKRRDQQEEYPHPQAPGRGALSSGHVSWDQRGPHCGPRVDPSGRPNAELPGDQSQGMTYPYPCPRAVAVFE